jgi:hypothetical protein
MPIMNPSLHNQKIQTDLHEFITADLKRRYPGSRIIANQPLDQGLRVDFAVEGKTPKDFIVLVEVKLGRPAPEDIMKISFYRKMIKGLKDRNIRVVLYSPVFPSKVRELARIADVELLELPERFFASAGSPKNIKITGEKAWKVVCQILRNGRSTIRQSSIKSGTSFGWAHAVFVQLQRSGIMEHQGNAYVVVDMPRLLDGIGWERPLSSLVVKEWPVEPETLDEVIADIRIADEDAILTGLAAAEGISDYSRRTNVVQVYSRSLPHLERQLGSSNKGMRIQVLRPDRDIPVKKEITSEKGPVHVVAIEQLILDLAGMGHSARDVLMKILEIYAGENNG